jgi:hypothetical protein
VRRKESRWWDARRAAGRDARRDAARDARKDSRIDATRDAVETPGNQTIDFSRLGHYHTIDFRPSPSQT